MAIIDSREEMLTLDASNMLGSIEQLSDQLNHGWEIGQAMDVSFIAQPIENIVVAGMGGSNLGAHVVKAAFETTLSVPIEVVPFYSLPAYVGKTTLVVLSSYSGATEETLTAAQGAKSKGAQVVVIAAGGALAEMAQENNWPLYRIDPKFNPSNQPRMAIGYSIMAFISIFAKLDLIQVTHDEISAVVDSLRERAQTLSPESSTNMAKHLAYELVDRLIILVSSQHLRGAAHVFNNQLNENAKQLTVELQLPEMNHHYMEALSFPRVVTSESIFVFINSKHYVPRVQTRYGLTETVAQNNGFHTYVIKMSTNSVLEEVFALIQFGAYTNYYLSMLNGLNPSPIPNVDFFKEELAKAD
jgi:glucose/mannose-6-phosphate isomerase